MPSTRYLAAVVLFASFPIVAQNYVPQTSTTALNSNRIGQKRMADQFNWEQHPTSPSSLAVGANTVTLNACPAGFLNTINGSNSNHWIYVDSAAADAQQPGEPVLITAENCLAGSASGTITFSVGYAHGAGYALESGTGGIKEALVDANQVRYTGVGNNTWVELTPNQVTTMKAPLYWQTTMGRLMGSSLIECTVNMSCINLGDTNSIGWANGNTNTYTNNVVDGFWLRPSQSMQFWDVAPSSPSSITQGGTSATLTISTCPPGFWPLIPNQILWLNGTNGGLITTAYGAAAPGPGEFVQVTGGTCTPGASNGTIVVAPATPGKTSLYAHGTGYTLSNGATPLIEDNSQSTVISNIQSNGWVGSVGYGFLIQNDNNQAEEATNVNMYGGIRCDNDFCGATLFGPGPNNINAGITNLVGGTNGPCAEWYNGNDFSMYSVVCQGYQDYGVFLSIKRGGSVQNARISKVHFERGGVSNSLGTNLGAAAMIVQGYNVTVDGGGAQPTSFPQFASNSGQDQLVYYLSTLDVTDGTKTIPIPIGTALATDPSVNNVPVRWVAGDVFPEGCYPAGTPCKTIKFELYRLDTLNVSGQVSSLAPYPGVCDGIGTDGKCLVATNINPATACDIHGACTFTDNIAPSSLTAATIETEIPFTGTLFSPFWSFSPGGVVLAPAGSYQGDPSCLVTNVPWLATISAVNTNNTPPSNCVASSGTSNNTLSSVQYQSIGYAQAGLILPDRTQTNDGGLATSLKGRLNFLGQGSTPRCQVTWWDANPTKTLSVKGGGWANSNSGNRPVWDVGDACTGVDGSNSLFDMFGTATTATRHWYAGVLPNSGGTNWTEELSLTRHAFTNQVQIGMTSNQLLFNGNTFSTTVSVANPSANRTYSLPDGGGNASFELSYSGTKALATSSIGANSCAAAQTLTLTGVSTSSVISWSFASTPIGVTGYGTGGLQISTFPTANTANIVVCNITGSSVTPGAMTLNVRALN